MNRFALDSSMTMAWCFEDEATPYSESVLERKKRLLPAQSLRFVELLQSLPITLDADVRPLGEILGLAREQGLSSYDASYLDLAVRTGLPLASLGGPLLEAAARFGVARFSFEDENR